MSNGRLLIGFVLLHVLCCGALLLFGAGAITTAGVALGEPLLIVAGGGVALVALVLAVRQVRGRSRGECCTPSPPSRDTSAPGAKQLR